MGRPKNCLKDKGAIIMTYKIIVSGFGGQGVLSAGKLLAYAAMLEDKFVSWLPSYGPEKRGGTSNCHVIISDEPVGSPFINIPNTVVAMSKQAFDKYESLIAKDGLLICDTNAVGEKSLREDIRVASVPATQMAVEAGMPKIANIILIGKLLKETGLFDEDEIIRALHEFLPENKHYLIPEEIKLLKMGINYGA